jgi:hypothetical protein
MAKFSMKKGGKEVGPASVYAPPHKGSKPYSAKQALAETEKGGSANEVNMSVGSISRNKPPAAKTSGIQVRGTGAATKGKMARGPMA